MYTHEPNRCIKCNESYLVIFRNDEVINSTVRCDNCSFNIVRDIRKDLEEAFDRIKKIEKNEE